MTTFFTSVVGGTTSTGVLTLNDATNATTGTITFHVVKPRNPEPVPLRRGDHVRVTAPGVLRGRRGRIAGFFGLEDRRLVMVSWPDGGWTMFGEDVLEPSPDEE